MNELRCFIAIRMRKCCFRFILKMAKRRLRGISGVLSCFNHEIVSSTSFQFRLKSSKRLHWAELKRKKWPTDLALRYFDDFYLPLFGRQWPSIRLGLLCPIKYCAVINNFSSFNELKMKEYGAYNISQKYKEKSEDNRKNKIHIKNKDEERCTNDNYIDNASLEERTDIGDRSDQGLFQYIPSSQMKGLEDFVDETDYLKHYNPKVTVPFQVETEEIIQFPEFLKIYTFPRADISSFPSPSKDKLSLLGYYLMDAASLMPVFALDIKYGDVVLDLCSAPGGKALTILQSLNPSQLVCNDVSLSRINRLKSVMKSYIPELQNSQTKIVIVHKDARKWPEENVYDKVLVDVPCTNDRLSVIENENNIFKTARIKERVALPEQQMLMLYSALRAVKVGGSVVYSTCSLSPIQNEGVVHMTLRKIWEETSIEVAVKDLSSSLQSFHFLFKFHKNLRYGHLIVPFLPLNHGPMFFCKIERKK